LKPSVEIVAAVAVAICLLVLAAQMALLMRGREIDVVGRPPVSRVAFMIAKLSMATSILCLVFGVLSRSAPGSPVALSAFFILLLGGTLILVLAFHRLGLNLRMGLPEEPTMLVCSGIYRYSRNPVYLGVFALMGASLAYAFSLLNLAAVAASVLLHHRIVLAEERFLTRQFPGYDAYRRSVRRYL
jgi:protein-S-isoprenylcysteine O-methyltransferase Ste14